MELEVELEVAVAVEVLLRKHVVPLPVSEVCAPSLAFFRFAVPRVPRFSVAKVPSS